MAAGATDIRLLVRAEVEKAIRDLNRTEKELNDLNKTAGKGAGTFGSLEKAVTGFVGVLAIREVADFAVETAKLSSKSNDLRRSLDNLAKKEGINTIQLMNDLRKATAGTVSDIELMQSATRGKFLGVDLKNLPVLFEFARRRAKDTGEDINFLVESITVGLGRKSPQILDNLGIQMSDLDREIELIARRTGEWNGKIDINLRNLHLQEAAVNLAKKAIKESGTQTETAADKIAQFNAAMVNFKTTIGNLVAGPLGDFISDLTVIVQLLSGEKAGEIRRLGNEIESLVKKIARLESGDLNFGDRLGMIVDVDFFKERLRQARLELAKLITPEIQNGLKRTGKAFRDFVNPKDTGGGAAGAGAGSGISELGEIAVRSSEAFQELFETVERDAPGFAEALRKGTIELAEQERLALEVGAIIENAFVNLADSLVDSATTGSEAWANFFEDLKRQIVSFLASQAVKAFLKFIAGAIFPGGSGLFGGVLGGLFGGIGGLFKSGGGSSLTAPDNLNLGNFPAPALVAGGGNSITTHSSIVERTVPIAGRIVVESAAPDTIRVRQHYINVNRSILREDNRFMDQFLSTKNKNTEFD